MNSHSIIPPSSAHIWGARNGCTGWAKISQLYPETEDTESAREGTASHEIGAGLLDKLLNGGFGPDLPAVDEPAENGVILTEEMWEGAELYADHFEAVYRSVPLLHVETGVENKVYCERIHAESHGTTDGWVCDHNARVLHIFDYKFGRIPVGAFENWQMANYFSGLAELLKVTLGWKVVFHVVQPRVNRPIKTWETTSDEVWLLCDTLRRNAAISLSEEGGTLRTGSHCLYCQARHACGPALAAGVGLFEVCGQPYPVDLSPAAMGLQLQIVERGIEQLRALKTGFEEQIKHLLKVGTTVPGWRVRPATGRESWSKPIDEVIMLGELLGHDLSKPGAITPNQARKLGVDDATLKLFASRKDNGLKLVREDSERVARIFKQES